MGAPQMIEWPNAWPMLSRPADSPALRVVSHGGGVQTSALLLMAARGDIGPMPDMAIMSDTGDEPQAVYDYLDYIRPLVPFPIVMVRRPGLTLAQQTIAVAQGQLPRKGASLPPLYTSQPKSMMRKQCSKEFKTRPVANEIRRLLGYAKGQRIPREVLVELWLGISKDEIHRAATNEKPWLHNRHPLLEMDLTRQGCIKWMLERQYRLPVKSSCVYCPFRDQPAWKEMAANAPADFARACEVDDLIRPGFPGMTGQAFVHRSMMPLREVDFTIPETTQLDFLTDCDSCGL